VLHPDGGHASEEYLEYGFHIVHQHFLEVLLPAIQDWVILFFPHFINYTLVDIPIFDMLLESLLEIFNF